MPAPTSRRGPSPRARATAAVTAALPGAATAGGIVLGAPWHVTAGLLVLAVTTALMPQRSRDRRDVWQALLTHRERHLLIRRGHAELLLRDRGYAGRPGQGVARGRPAGERGRRARGNDPGPVRR
ncbi:hypothetical protein [Streptantibioticus cattleyicolor]|uniref:Uncharacterized protein n=1 Tax=Streptantibioticus cattleyicolor (strain ATCC 35852 / DSM 46488 / JCM 4925 / NBRC 14057 / NRRL 8057) TaxID=1003195 RepID=F8JK71_STREN|nr:hypothetical protein [Streptantibioticus cattleyicolor]AEW98568.1 hypothetical protein SCATT_p03750 [Streptantibioticus cattleyicolor NRRL 8057 = DSM 46488]CCB72374.1 exported protein of unknown function [Streptantibioticus cattleyicolor NRRL 8057 = DSM 46488]